jgi:hypothetical protein
VWVAGFCFGCIVCGLDVLVVWCVYSVWFRAWVVCIPCAPLYLSIDLSTMHSLI